MAIDKKTLGLIVGAVALTGFCSSLMHEPKPSPAASPQASAAAITTTIKGEFGALGKRVVALRANPDQEARRDPTGKKFDLWENLDAKPALSYAVVKGNPAAWRVVFDGTPCGDVSQLGPELERLASDHLGALAKPWHRVVGGPLDGVFVQSHAESVTSPNTCSIQPGTKAYWDQAGISIPGQPPAPPVEREPLPEAPCVLGFKDRTYVPFFPTAEGFNEWVAAAAGKNNEAAQVAAEANGAFEVDRGTRCNRLDFGTEGLRVRLLSGKHRGKAGWVRYDWVQRE